MGNKPEQNIKKRKKGKNPDDQQQAVVKLVWGTIVFATGVLGCFGVAVGITFLVVLGAILDAVDGIAMAAMGGIISAAFFGLAGTIICFAAFSTPWWYGLCAGMCFESAVGGAVGYGLRFYNFCLEKREDGTMSGTKSDAPDIQSAKKNIKRSIRQLIEKL